MRLPHRPILAMLGALLLAAGCSGDDSQAPSPAGGGGGGGGGGTPPPSGWNTQVTIGAARNDADVDIYGVDVDLNEGGTGIATWEEAGDVSPVGAVWVAWYRGGAWETAVRLTDVDVAAVLPRVALNDAGDAVVAYEAIGYDQNGWPASRTVWARRWMGGAWTAPQRLCDAPPAPGELYASRPRVGIDAQGRALVVWDQLDVSLARPNTIIGARFDGSSWSPPFLVSGGTRYSAWADVAVSADGSAAVLWVQDTNPYDPGLPGGGPSIPNIWARVFGGSSWGDPQRIGNANLADFEGCERPRVVADASGRAFAIWEEHRAAENRIVSAALDPAGPSWSAPATLATSTGGTVYLSFPSIATDGNGNAFGVWQSDAPGGGGAYGAYARYAAGAWGAAELFESGGDVPGAVAAMDGAANAWALYSMAGMKARRQDPALGWQAVSAVGPGRVTDAEANGAGMVIVGGYDPYYSQSPLGFFVSARAIVYVP